MTIAEAPKAVHNGRIDPLEDGTVYSKRKGFRPFTTPGFDSYAPLMTQERIDRLLGLTERLRGLKLLEINATAQGGGVAEMQYGTMPFMNDLGIEAEWAIVHGNDAYFEVTKSLHNMLQGKKAALTPKMERTYFDTLERCATAHLADQDADVVLIHDPQPLGLDRYIKRSGQTWLWRIHIDMEESTLRANPRLWSFMTSGLSEYQGAIFSSQRYVVESWPMPKFVIPPCIDPLSNKNKDLGPGEIEAVLAKYRIDPSVPIIAQIGRFDPWKGLDRTIATYREVRKKMDCQLVLAGGFASDDPEGPKFLDHIREETKDDEGVHVLQLSLDNRLENWTEVNALQRAATVVMAPSTKEGFGLVITEALWKANRRQRRRHPAADQTRRDWVLLSVSERDRQDRRAPDRGPLGRQGNRRQWPKVRAGALPPPGPDRRLPDGHRGRCTRVGARCRAH